MQIGELQSVDTQAFLEHDLMQFTESHHFGLSGVMESADVVVRSVVDIQYVLNDVLCDHESPRDQNLVGGNEQQQQQQPPAESNCKRQHQPPAATAITTIFEEPAPA